MTDVGVIPLISPATEASFAASTLGWDAEPYADEAVVYGTLSNLGVARWLQSSWKLSRAFGVSNVAVLHRVSDLRSVGASDSEQVALALSAR